MAEIEVKFVLPPDNREISVELDETMRPPEIVNALLEEGMIKPNPHGYLLALKGGDFLNNDRSLSQLGLRPGNVMRVVPATDAGWSDQ